MLQNNDLVLLLTELEAEGDTEASKFIYNIVGQSTVSLDALKYINNHRHLDVVDFYEGLRKSYNNKKSKLYKNLLKDELSVNDSLATLHSFALQLFLYSKKLEDSNKLMFYKHIRAEEITRVLNDYYKTYNISSIFKMMRLLRADLVAFEVSTGRRQYF